MLVRTLVMTFVFILLFIAATSSTADDNAEGDSLTKRQTGNLLLPKNQPQLKIVLHTQSASPYLWIMAHARDNRKIEHGAGKLQIKVNGRTIEAETSVLQSPSYNQPVHPRSWRIPRSKYDPDLQAWSFKYDVDFVMNNQCGSSGKWGVYTTSQYNHWYLLNLESIAKPGPNEITLIEKLPNSDWKRNYYDGFMIGELALCGLDEGKEKIAAYNERQITIDPDELDMQKIVEAKYRDSLQIPAGRRQVLLNKAAHLTKNGKPFFMTYLNSFPGSPMRQSLLEIYSYHALINSCQPLYNCDEIKELPIYLQEGWNDYKLEPWEYPVLLACIQAAYRNGILSLPYYYDNQRGSAFLQWKFPYLMAKTRAEQYATTPRGRHHPNYAHPDYQCYTDQFVTVLGKTFHKHPGVAGYCVWEEPGWRLSQPKGKMVPQSADDLLRYRIWLEGKYQIISRLNEEWNTDHRDFSTVEFPLWKEQSANFVNFQLWRSQAVLTCVEKTWRALKNSDPTRFVMGQKTYGDIGAATGYWQHCLDNWRLTEYVDVAREYSGNSAMAHLGRASCRQFGKVMEANICLSEDAYKIHNKTDPWDKLLDQKADNIYPYLMSALFNENKALHWEIYDSLYGASFHFLVYNKRWKKEAKTWDGKDLNYLDAGTADVVIPEKTLKISRLHQWALRNASLFLPARTVSPQVAVLLSNSSRMIGYDPDNKLAKTAKLIQTWVDNVGQDFYRLGSLFDSLHLKFDCLDDRFLDKLFEYRVLIVGYQANVSNQKVADMIQEFARRGGTVIFYPEAACMRDIDFRYTDEAPGFGLSSLVGACFDRSKLVKYKGLTMTAADSQAAPMDIEYYGVPMELKPGGRVLATDGAGQPVLAVDQTGRNYCFAAYLGLSYFQSFPQHRQFAQIIGDILSKAGVQAPISLQMGSADTEPRLLLPGLMRGDGYWLASVNNFSARDQDVTLGVNALPPMKYEVVDISGEQPLPKKKADGNFFLEPNFAAAQPAYVNPDPGALVTSVPAGYSKVFLIRPAGGNVWLNAGAGALKSYLQKDKEIKVVIGQNCSQKARSQVDRLLALLARKGVSATVVNDDAVNTRVVEGRLQDDDYVLATYRHEIIDTETDLLLIGNPEENLLTRHLHGAGNYVYCKVPEMISARYPGKDRGVIQIAECVNHISYDATDKARDAIILAGSNDKGTERALDRFIELLQ